MEIGCGSGSGKLTAFLIAGKRSTEKIHGKNIEHYIIPFLKEFS